MKRLVLKHFLGKVTSDSDLSVETDRRQKKPNGLKNKENAGGE
jgi:hypothetical protein